MSRQVLATDHAVFNTTQKRRGRQDFRQIPNGVNGIEERLHVAWEELVNSGAFFAVCRCLNRGNTPARGTTTFRGSLWLQSKLRVLLCLIPVPDPHDDMCARCRSDQPIGFRAAREHSRCANIWYLSAKGASAP